MEVSDDFYVNMAMAPNQKMPGSWGTLDNIPNVEYVRNKLAVTPEFKNSINRVQIYKLPNGTRIQVGIVGVQEYNGVMYLGGSSQVEILSLPSGRGLIPVGPAKFIK